MGVIRDSNMYLSNCFSTYAFINDEFVITVKSKMLYSFFNRMDWLLNDEILSYGNNYI